jgi:hypothetical protein
VRSDTMNSDTVPVEVVEHQPSIGCEYKTAGLDGQRVAVVGYSHWSGELDGKDYAEFTKDVILGVMDGRIQRTNFFTCIRDYFGFDSHADFWSKVVFFNYLPRCVGGPDQRYAKGTKKDHSDGNVRFRRIIGECAARKVVVFSAKAWDSPMPPFDRPLKSFSVDGVEGAMRPEPCGIYLVNDHTAQAFGLHHPQGAPGHKMRMAVQRIVTFNAGQADTTSD